MAVVFAGPSGEEKSLPEPRVDAVIHYQAADGGLEPLPRETVKRRGKRGAEEVSIAGGAARVRFRRGELPRLVVSYPIPGAPQGLNRLYRFEVREGARVTRLGVGVTASGREAGRLEMPIRKHGAVSLELVLPADLGPGEYAISSPTGATAFCFAVE